jgi:hypothetical protein
MSRLPLRSINDAPDASRPLLEAIAQSTPTGQPLNLHGQLANSPAVLAAYTSLRTAGERHGTLDARVRGAVMLAAATSLGNPYPRVITEAIAARTGWTAGQVHAIEGASPTGDTHLDAILTVAREAVRNRGDVTDRAWTHALQAGWTSEELTETFLYLAIVIFTDTFVSYAHTALDLALERASG